MRQTKIVKEMGYHSAKRVEEKLMVKLSSKEFYHHAAVSNTFIAIQIWFPKYYNISCQITLFPTI